MNDNTYHPSYKSVSVSPHYVYEKQKRSDSFITDKGERLTFPDFSYALFALNMKFSNKTHLKIQHVSFYSGETWAIVSVLTGQTVFQNTCEIKITFEQKFSV